MTYEEPGRIVLVFHLEQPRVGLSPLTLLKLGLLVVGLSPVGARQRLPIGCEIWQRLPERVTRLRQLRLQPRNTRMPCGHTLGGRSLITALRSALASAPEWVGPVAEGVKLQSRPECLQ
jgi:hypothetical protein